MVNYDSQGGFLVTSIVQNNLQGGPIFRSSPANKSRVTMPMESSHGVLNNILGSPDNIKAANTPSSTPYMQPHQSAYLSNPSVSVLTVKQVNFRHAGNYTCAPSNARPASITVHVLRGESYPQYFKILNTYFISFNR